MINFDTYVGTGNPSALAKFREIEIDPVDVIHNNSYNHIQEVYQNLPQLINKAIYQHPTYNDLSRENYRFEQEESRPPPLEAHPSNHRHHIFPSRMGFGSAMRNVLHRKGSDKNANKRNGHGWGWGETSHHDSPAISALALLGFMFFLNLIQMSLQNNRQLLAAKAYNATGIIAAGRSHDIPRYRRDVPPLGPISYTTSETDSTLLDPNIAINSLENPIKYTQMEQPPPHPPKFQRKSKRRTSSKFMDDDHVNFVGSRDPQRDFTTTYPIPTSNLNSKEDPVESFKSMSLQCFQLIACKLGRSILENLDGTTGVVVRMLGSSLIPQIPQKTWTGRLMRAFNKGWNQVESCEAMFRKCESLARILNLYSSNKIQSLRRKKSV